MAGEALFEQMVARFRQAPSPAPIWLEEVSVGDLAAAEAVAVMYGWTNRVMRTGQAALQLDAIGFATEVSPLLRSMVEHVIALHWVREEPGDAFQALVRQRQQQLTAYEQTEVTGWELTDDIRVRIAELLGIGTEESSKYMDHLLHTFQRVQRYGLGALYRAWLVETWTAHASLASATTYYETRGDSEIVLLADNPDVPISVPALCTAFGLAALDVYNEVLPGEFMTDDIDEWNRQLSGQ